MGPPGARVPLAFLLVGLAVGFAAGGVAALTLLGRDAPAAALVDVRLELRSDGAEVAFTPAGARVRVEVELMAPAPGALEVGPLLPAGRLAEAWRIDPEARLEREVPGHVAFDLAVAPGRAHALRLLPIASAMGEGMRPRARVRVTEVP